MKIIVFIASVNTDIPNGLYGDNTESEWDAWYQAATKCKIKYPNKITINDCIKISDDNEKVVIIPHSNIICNENIDAGQLLDKIRAKISLSPNDDVEIYIHGRNDLAKALRENHSVTSFDYSCLNSNEPLFKRIQKCISDLNEGNM